MPSSRRTSKRPLVTPWWDSLWWARIVFATLIVTEVLGALRIIPITAEFTWKGLLLQSVGALVLFEILNVVIRRKRIPYFLGPAALLFAALLTIDAAGDMGHLYGRFMWYDEILHLVGGFVTAVITTGLLAAIHRDGRGNGVRTAELVLNGTSLAVLAQVLYEFEEYFEDVLTGSQRLGDGFDTVNDLTLALFGALIAATIVTALAKHRRSR